MASAVLSVNGRFLSVGEDLRLFFGRKKPSPDLPERHNSLSSPSVGPFQIMLTLAEKSEQDPANP